MNPYKLYGRRDQRGPFKLESYHSSYRNAVLKGQNRFGYGMFAVAHTNPNHDFTREEQLLKPTNTQELLDSL